MLTGKVKFYNNAKKFGFIREDASGKEYFVHELGCVDKIANDDEVTFELTDDKRGMKCINVKKK